MGFKENLERVFDEYLGLVEISDFPLAVDPFSMGIDERTIDEITPEERNLVWQVICQKLGIETFFATSTGFVREYNSKTEQNEEIEVTVISTKRKGIFLHILSYTDGEVRWALGPNVNI